MAYTDIDKPTDYFNTVLYTGNGGTNAITGVGFQPDWVWIKNRPDARDHQIYDSVRGATKVIGSDRTAAEATVTNGLTAFGSDGFTVGADANVNDNGDSHVAWNWLAGGSASSNTDGDLTVTSLSVNQTAGFSIGKITNGFTSTGSNSETVGHGLNAIPKMIILKNIEATSNWFVYHASLGNTNRIYLNTADASSSSTIWNNTTPTSSVWSVRGGDFGTGEDIVFYAFAEKKGFSRFGSYQGNGSNDGSYIHLGFKPAFVLIRRTDSGDNWPLFDNKRNEFNLTDKRLYPNSNSAELTASSVSLDLLSNGFKLRGTDSQINNSSGTYIYMAFAENPFVTSTGIPTTAK
jgi:hypothetical protein